MRGARTRRRCWDCPLAHCCPEFIAGQPEAMQEKRRAEVARWKQEASRHQRRNRAAHDRRRLRHDDPLVRGGFNKQLETAICDLVTDWM